jgi:hypothetical protein
MNQHDPPFTPPNPYDDAFDDHLIEPIDVLDDTVPFDDEYELAILSGDLNGLCPYCDQLLLDDTEVGQGYHITAPCHLWATGQIAEALAWHRTAEKENIRQFLTDSPDSEQLWASGPRAGGASGAAGGGASGAAGRGASSQGASGPTGDHPEPDKSVHSPHPRSQDEQTSY